MFAGEPAAAREHCEAGRRLYDPERHRSHRLLYGGHDPGVCAGYMGAQVHWLLGYPEKGLALGSEALALAERIAHPFSLGTSPAVSMRCFTLIAASRNWRCNGSRRPRRWPPSNGSGFVLEPQLLRGAALTAQGAFEEAVACLREGLAGRPARCGCAPTAWPGWPKP